MAGIARANRVAIQHLSVMDYKKVQRAKEVAALDEQITVKQDEISSLVVKEVDIKGELSNVLEKLDKSETTLKTVKEKEKFIAKHASHYDDDPKYKLPEPKPLMYAKTYHDKFASPLVKRLKNVIRSILLQFIEKTQELRSLLDRANEQIRSLSDRVKKLEPENERLRVIERDYSRVRRYLGKEHTDEIINKVKTQEIIEKQQQPQKQIKHNRNSYAR